MNKYVDCDHKSKCTHGLLCTYLHTYDDLINKCKCQLEFVKLLDINEDYVPYNLV